MLQDTCSKVNGRLSRLDTAQESREPTGSRLPQLREDPENGSSDSESEIQLEQWETAEDGVSSSSAQTAGNRTTGKMSVDVGVRTSSGSRRRGGAPSSVGPESSEQSSVSLDHAEQFLNMLDADSSSTSLTKLLETEESDPLLGLDEWRIDTRLLVIGSKISSGSQAKVFKGSYQRQEVMIKVMQPSEGEDERKKMDLQFMSEVRTLSKMQHTNVINLVGAFKKNPVWIIVMEYLAGGSLRSFLSKRQPLSMPLRIVVGMAVDIAHGLSYLHSKGIVHKRLRSDNLHLTADKTVKITEFCAAHIERESADFTNESNAFRWMAPELQQNKGMENDVPSIFHDTRQCTPKADVYSFGIILWELFTCVVPFDGMTAVQASFAVVNRGVRPKIPDNCPIPLTNIMNLCWAANPEKRPSMDDVVRMLQAIDLEPAPASPKSPAPSRGCGKLPRQQTTSAGHVSRPRQQATSADHISTTRPQQGVPHQQAPAWSMLKRSQTAVMDQKPGETDEAYQARMLLLITEAKQRSDAVAAAAKKKAEDAEKARLLAIEQDRQQDEAATKAAYEERIQQREKIFSGERALLTMAATWQAEAENGKMEESEKKIALLLSHLTDLLATCITQQEDIQSLDDALAQVSSRLQQLEQRPVAAPDASSSNTSDHLEALEIDVGSLKDDVQLQQIATQYRSLEDHLEHRRRVLETLRHAKYKANRDKCEFVRQELEYLGHFVTPEGISPFSDKIQAIKEWPELRNITDVRSFLGLAGYCQRFIKGYSKIAAHLTKLQCEYRSFDFGEDAWESFLALKAALLSAKVLRIYDPLLPTRVTTDAFGYGIGAILEQHNGMDRHPVEYFSKKVSVVHSIDDARKKEFLAFVHALKWWRHFLLGRSQF
ncbi:hypothetical protein CBR_g22920 [Chara braunii]|uniref:Protein kinase domain-containing protein n=1 Tax=Chara braunii TaxID=69332 RepID=A0A388L375_CHABU|nr:hypothetical protein CBR_g22920 [Chara braunii]|eukprot:GBG76702.1 hypothetical protein CBR_g22920 [Chara braunii]